MLATDEAPAFEDVGFVCLLVVFIGFHEFFISFAYLQMRVADENSWYYQLGIVFAQVLTWRSHTCLFTLPTSVCLS